MKTSSHPQASGLQTDLPSMYLSSFGRHNARLHNRERKDIAAKPRRAMWLLVPSPPPPMGRLASLVGLVQGCPLAPEACSHFFSQALACPAVSTRLFTVQLLPWDLGRRQGLGCQRFPFGSEPQGHPPCLVSWEAESCTSPGFFPLPSSAKRVKGQKKTRSKWGIVQIWAGLEVRNTYSVTKLSGCSLPGPSLFCLQLCLLFHQKNF